MTSCDSADITCIRADFEQFVIDTFGKYATNIILPDMSCDDAVWDASEDDPDVVLVWNASSFEFADQGVHRRADVTPAEWADMQDALQTRPTALFRLWESAQKSATHTVKVPKAKYTEFAQWLRDNGAEIVR